LRDAEQGRRVTEETRERKTKYWLRRKSTDIGTAHNDEADAAATPELIDSNTADSVPHTPSIADDLQDPRVSEATGHEQAIGSRVEVGQDQTRNEEHRIPRYDFRPLPGRKIA
jgi:hypothetical protein